MRFDEDLKSVQEEKVLEKRKRKEKTRSYKIAMKDLDKKI
jgi:hypothetical protein